MVLEQILTALYVLLPILVPTTLDSLPSSNFYFLIRNKPCKKNKKATKLRNITTKTKQKSQTNNALTKTNTE